MDGWERLPPQTLLLWVLLSLITLPHVEEHQAARDSHSLAHFTLGVKANLQPKSCIPIDAKVEISSKGFLH
jgi:hypothetical protein